MSAIKTQLQRGAEKETATFPPALQALVRTQLETTLSESLRARELALAALAKAKDPDVVAGPYQAKLELLKTKRAKLVTEIESVKVEAFAIDLEMRQAHQKAEAELKRLRAEAMPQALVSAVRAVLQEEIGRLTAIPLPKSILYDKGTDTKIATDGPARTRLNNAVSKLERAIGDLEHMAAGTFDAPKDLDAWVQQLVEEARRDVQG